MPCGKAALVTLLNPQTGKAAQLSFSDNQYGEQYSGRNNVFYGFSKIVLSSLSTSTRDKLSAILGGDCTQLRDLLVSTKSIASITAASAASRTTPGGSLDDEC